MHSSLKRMEIDLVITHLPPSKPEIKQLLQANGVIAKSDTEHRGRCLAFPSMERGLAYCEERMLDVAVQFGLCRPLDEEMTLAEVRHAELMRPHAQ